MRIVPVLALALLTLAPGAGRAEGLFDAPVLYVQFDVRVKADHSATVDANGGTGTETVKLDKSFSAVSKLDMRNVGQLLTMTQMDPDKYKNLSQAEMMKVSQQMMEAMQYAANWMASDPDPALLNTRGARVDYTLAYTGWGIDEMNARYDFRKKTTATGGGAARLPMAPQLEMNSQSRKYWLTCLWTCAPFTDERVVKIEDHDWRQSVGSAPVEGTETRDAPIDWLPGSIEFAASDQFGQVPVVEGPIGSGNSITGEKVFNVKLVKGTKQVPATVTFNYVISATPPATPAR